ncbi:MAG TPA: hypothetical protein VFB13_22420 [Reyranella sp.]|nr:hypothetical protein [Reyranella sp.]
MSLATFSPKAARASVPSWLASMPLCFGLAVFTILVFGGATPMLGDPDTQWHVATGRWILQQGRVPRTDPFSFTFAGQEWIAKEWLSQVILAAAHAAGGWPGVAALACVVTAATFALLFRLLAADVGGLLAAILSASAVILTAPHLLARPHLLALPVMVLWTAGLVRAVERDWMPSPWLLVLMLLWANLHGGFTLGFMLAVGLGLEAVATASDRADRVRKLIGWLGFGVAAVVVAGITPYGWRPFFVTHRILELGSVLPLIDEWRSPDWQRQPAQLAVLLFAAVVALLGAVKVPLLRALVVAGLLYLYFRFARNAELLGLLAPILLAPIVARRWSALIPVVAAGRAAPPSAAARAATMAALCAAVLAAGWSQLRHSVLPPAVAPASAIAFARGHALSGPVLNDYGFGGYLVNERVPTFIDGRAELYGRNFILRYVAAISGHGGLAQLLDEYGIEWTLLRPDRPANELLALMPNWCQAYHDENATLFVRSSAPGRGCTGP